MEQIDNNNELANPGVYIDENRFEEVVSREEMVTRLIEWCFEMSEDHHRLALFDTVENMAYHFSYKLQKKVEIRAKFNLQEILNLERNMDDILYDESDFIIISNGTMLKRNQRTQIKESIEYMLKFAKFIYYEF